MNDPAEWEAIHKSRMWGTYPDIHVVRQVKKFRGQWKGEFWPYALDIGCGAGANTMMMVREGMDVAAFDGSETAIKHMVNAVSDNGYERRVAVSVADVQAIELASESLDFILDNFTLTNIEHPPWERILSWLKPGGWLVHASFSVGPKDSPKTWHHTSPGEEVERHEIWNDHGSHAFTVRRYIKPS